MTTEPRASAGMWGNRSRALLVAAALLVVACSGPERIEWPGARFDLPDGWELIAQDQDELVLVDHLAEAGERGVLIRFRRVPGVLPDDLRAEVSDRGATLESDEGILIAGDVPATQLVLLDEVLGTPVREAILIVASRDLVIAVSPVVELGDQDGPELLLESLDGVRAVLDTIELALPTLG